MTYPLLKKCTGLNTIASPLQLSETELQYAKDVMITDNERLIRADGYTKIISLTNGHSLFNNGNTCIVSDGTGIYNIAADNSITLITSLSNNNKISYENYGNAIYLVNGIDTKVIENGIAYSWEPEENFDSNSFDYYEPSIPNFKKIFFFAGQMWGIYENGIFPSFPGSLGLFNLERGYFFGSNVIGAMPVIAGIFVSTEEEIIFLRGSTIENFVENVVANYPMYEWAIDNQGISAKTLGIENDGICAIWNTKRGPCLGTPNGYFIPLVDMKVHYPTNGSFGATLVRGKTVINTVNDLFCTDTNLMVGEFGSKATTQRSNFAFNSFCRRGNDFLACASDGIYLLGGDTHNGTAITGIFETRTVDMDYDGPKGARSFSINGEASSVITVTPTVDDIAYTAITITPRKTGQQFMKKTIPYNVKGYNWKFRCSCESDFSIDLLSILPKALSRGISVY
jgi:hypothetical protein